MNFSNYCSKFSASDDQSVVTNETFVISFTNSRNEVFSIDPHDVIKFLEFLLDHYSDVEGVWKTVDQRKFNLYNYEEKSYRAIYKYSGDFEGLKIIGSLGGSQTKALTRVISKFICFLSGDSYSSVENNTFFVLDSINKALANKPIDIKALHSEAEIFQKNDESVKNRFAAWLKSKGLSERSVYSYAVTGMNKCESVLIHEKYPVKNIYLLTYEKALEALEVLKKNQSWVEANTSGNSMYSAAMARFIEFLKEPNVVSINRLHLSKSFILLPGISGTGKSRFVRMQSNEIQLLIVPVRPDWHEPSDLLGYVSRIGVKPEYVATDSLRFMAKAWKNGYSTASVDGLVLKPVAEMETFWLCLDEMNLAPVEQYFADYLSVLESRRWDGSTNGYTCDPILRIHEGVDNIRAALGLDDGEYDGLWAYFKAKGMPLPPNLIVAGTVNMDETTHGFSRKVIDRALTFDFGEFFPNDFDDYFGQSAQPVKLGFPTRTYINDSSQLAGSVADSDGNKSIKFLEAVNAVLKGTPFELAYRALNELLLSVYFHAPGDDAALKAVWDDFIMMKVMPRIEGDNEKLVSGVDANSNVIQQLVQLLAQDFPEGGDRVDFYRRDKSGQQPRIPFRSIRKLKWMQQRLQNNGFTSFWP